MTVYILVASRPMLWLGTSVTVSIRKIWTESLNFRASERRSRYAALSAPYGGKEVPNRERRW